MPAPPSSPWQAGGSHRLRESIWLFFDRPWMSLAAAGRVFPGPAVSPQPCPGGGAGSSAVAALSPAPAGHGAAALGVIRPGPGLAPSAPGLSPVCLGRLPACPRPPEDGNIQSRAPLPREQGAREPE